MTARVILHATTIYLAPHAAVTVLYVDGRVDRASFPGPSLSIMHRASRTDR